MANNLTGFERFFSECTAEINVYYRTALVDYDIKANTPLVSHQYTFSLLIG